MKQETVVMSKRETHRMQVIEQYKSGQIQQVRAAQILNLTPRHLRRLIKQYEACGPQGLVSGHRGKPSNHQLPAGIKEQALALIREHYSDFGPTLAEEYLADHHDISIGVETLRQLMLKDGLWHDKHKKKKAIHQQRLRREKFGELIQIDGSHHDWFEGRSAKCCLLVFIDDATSAIVHLYFCDAETTHDYFTASHDYFKKYGLPMAFYSDKHGVFRVNATNIDNNTGKTQFGRAMDELGIELINANSPQAKGRVERANATLQDRLVKAMRIANINTIEEANDFLPEFIEMFNDRFAKLPQCDANAHCELQLENGALGHILSIHSKRTLSARLECSYNNVTYQIKEQAMKNRLQCKKVKVIENAKGEVSIFYNDKQLGYQTIDKNCQQNKVHDDKTLNAAVDKLSGKKRKTPYKPHAEHPWRQYPKGSNKQEPQTICA